MGAEGPRAGNGHGRADAKTACFVAGGADNRAGAEAAGNGDRQTTKLGAAEELHRDEECIEVDVDDGCGPFAHLFGF